MKYNKLFSTKRKQLTKDVKKYSKKIDTDNSGTLEIEELKHYLSKALGEA